MRTATRTRPRCSASNLRTSGSRAAPGFMKPEGVVIYHEAARQMFKMTIEGDEAGKEGEQ